MTKMNHLPISYAEEERIQKMIDSDPDTPEVADEHVAEARHFVLAFPAMAENMQKNAGGRRRSADPKVPVSVRLDREVVAKFKATGPRWQNRMNEVLTDRYGARTQSWYEGSIDWLSGCRPR